MNNANLPDVVIVVDMRVNVRIRSSQTSMHGNTKVREACWFIGLEPRAVAVNSLGL